jgi:hypothetical protein
MAVKMLLDAAGIPGPDRRALGEALVDRIRETLASNFPQDQGYHHSTVLDREPLKDKTSPGESTSRELVITRLGVSRGAGWGIRISFRPETEPPGSMRVVVREALPLFEKLKKGVLILTFVAAFGIGIVSLIAGLVQGGPARKGIVMTALLFGGLSGLATGVGGLFLLSPVHLLCRFRLSRTVRETGENLRRAIREATEPLKAEVPVKSSGSIAGWLFLGAALFGAGLVGSVHKARASTEDPFTALWILSCVMTGLGLLIFLAGHLSEEYGFTD